MMSSHDDMMYRSIFSHAADIYSNGKVGCYGNGLGLRRSIYT
jgi:hypothetical protein